MATKNTNEQIERKKALVEPTKPKKGSPESKPAPYTPPQKQKKLGKKFFMINYLVHINVNS